MKRKIRTGEFKPPNGGRRKGTGNGPYTHACTICSATFVNYKPVAKVCSRPCFSDYMRAWVRSNRDHLPGPHKRSWMETEFGCWLNKNYDGRWFEQIHFWNEETHRNGWLDFVFPQLKLVVELDGNHHANRKEKDETRDEYLSRVRGYRVVRITHREFVRGTRIDEITELLKRP